MAIFSSSFLGNKVRKRVGNVTTYTLNGQCVARSIPLHVGDPKSPKQLQNRERMKRVFDLSSVFSEVHACGFPERKRTHSTYNAFVSANRGCVEVDEQLRTSVDWSRLVCSAGSLAAPKVAVVRGVADDELVFTMMKGCVGERHWSSDVVYATLYNKKTMKASLQLLCQRSRAKQVVIELPPEWKMEDVEIYCFAVSVNGRLASKTVYLRLDEPNGQRSVAKPTSSPMATGNRSNERNKAIVAAEGYTDKKSQGKIASAPS